MIETPQPRRSLHNSKLAKLILAGALLVVQPIRASSPLPDSVILPPGVVLPDDFVLPEGLTIPEGFEITQDMVDQYLKYLEDLEADGKSAVSGDSFFKELAQDHANGTIQMNALRIDAASANEESSFSDKFWDSLLNKDIILPVITVVLLCIAVWAFMTKCGRRKCCKKAQAVSQPEASRKSVKSDRSQTGSGNDLESNHTAQQTNLGSDGRLSQLSSQNKEGLSKLEMSSKMAVNRTSDPPSCNYNQRQNTLGSVDRASTLSAPPKTTSITASRLSLPTVQVPINQIRSKRVRIEASRQDSPSEGPSSI